MQQRLSGKCRVHEQHIYTSSFYNLSLLHHTLAIAGEHECQQKLKIDKKNSCFIKSQP